MAISLELRARIVKAHLDGQGTYKELASLFGVGEATVSRLLRRHRERGDVRRDPRGGGMPPKVPERLYASLRKLVAEKPDRTVAQIAEAWKAFHGVTVSRSAMMRALRKAGFTWKKNGFVLRSRTGPTSRHIASASRKR